MEEADRDRLHPLGHEVREDPGKGGEIDGMQLLAAVAHAPGQLAAQAPRHEGLGLAVVEIEEVGPVAARDLQGVAEPFGGDEPDSDSVAFGQRIDDYRGAVGEEGDRCGIDPRLFQHPEHPFLVVRRGGVGLRDAHRGRAAVRIGLEGHEIGEGSPDVGRDAYLFFGHGQAPPAAGELTGES